MDKTSKLGLNLPDKGFRDWDVPINENFSLIDSKVAVLGLDNIFTGTNTFNKSVYLIQADNDKLQLKDTRVDVSAETGTDTFNTIIFKDKNNFDYGTVAINDAADGSKRIRFSVANKLPDGTTKSDQIWVRVKKDGTIDTYAPTPADNSNNTNIAVTSWVRKLFALLTGNNTFSGTNTFTGAVVKVASSSAPMMVSRQNHVTLGTNPSANTNTYIVSEDSTGAYQSYIAFEVRTDGSGVITLAARNNSSSDRASSGMQIARKLDGTSWLSIGTTTASAPTPAISSNSKDIATTAYINNKFQKVDALPANANPNVWYFIKE